MSLLPHIAPLPAEIAPLARAAAEQRNLAVAAWLDDPDGEGAAVALERAAQWGGVLTSFYIEAVGESVGATANRG